MIIYAAIIAICIVGYLLTDRWQKYQIIQLEGDIILPHAEKVWTLLYHQVAPILGAHNLTDRDAFLEAALYTDGYRADEFTGNMIDDFVIGYIVGITEAIMPKDMSERRIQTATAAVFFKIFSVELGDQLYRKGITIQDTDDYKWGIEIGEHDGFHFVQSNLQHNGWLHHVKIY